MRKKLFIIGASVLQLPAISKAKRTELGLHDDDIALISAGDLIPRKNYGVAIQAITQCRNERLHYYICGKGFDKEKLETLAKELGVDEQVHFLGFRNDVKALMAASDIFLFTTLQEGMPRSMMEAMACGLPCIASKIRGNVDLINDGINGYLCPPTDFNGFSQAIQRIANDETLRQQMRKHNLESIKQYDIAVVEKEIEMIYREVLSGKAQEVKT